MFTASIFSQLLKLVPRDQFCQLVDQHGSDRWYKRFGSWDHLVTMLAVYIWTKDVKQGALLV